VGTRRRRRRATSGLLLARSLVEVIHSSVADRGRTRATGKSLLGILKDPVGGMKMSVTIKRITLWRIEVENKPGVLARTLEPLAGVGDWTNITERCKAHGLERKAPRDASRPRANLLDPR